MEEMDTNGGVTSGGDTEILLSLGANIVDREEFENELVGRLEKRLEEQQQTETLTDETPASVGNISPEEGELVADTEEEVLEVANNESSSTNGSSILLQALMSKRNNRDVSIVSNVTPTRVTSDSRSKSKRGDISTASINKERQSSTPAANNNNIKKQRGNAKDLLAAQVPEETEQEKRIRQGEMTPFGTEVEVSTRKSDSFMNFNKYLQSQSELQQKKGKAQNEKTDKNHHHHKHKKGSKNPLDMNVLFPKKRKRKEELGTEMSEDPRDTRKRTVKSLAEKTSMYLNSSDDSEYIPSESEASDNNDGPSTSFARQSTRKKKNVKKNLVEKSSGEESSDYNSDSERPTKRLKKEADDGNVIQYQKRVQKWKENETRFTGEFHKFDGGFKIPSHLWSSLYTYQKVGVKWLWELHLQRCGGILGDEMGLGKTIQVINFLVGISCSQMLFRFTEYRGLGPVLLVTPATVMHQWVKEFHTWWPPFRVAILHESGSYSGSKSGLIRSIQDGNGILITSYTGLVNNQNEILMYPWHYMILDEGHKIRNPDAQITLVAKQVKTPHRLILSGSPLQNNLKELWSLFDFVYPGKLGTLPTFMEQFAVPITHGGYSNATEIQVAVAYKCAKALRDMINPFLLRRMKSDVKDHINLPEKNEQVLFCKMTEDQKGLYKSYVASKEIDSIIQGRFNLFVGLINLRKICNHPHLFDGGPKIIQANPHFHKKIPKVKSGLNGVEAEVEELEDEGSDIELDPKDSFGHWSKSGKMVVVETLLRLWHAQGHKVLLFTQSRQMLCILENFIRQCKYKYLRMDGVTTISSRQPMITKFNEDPDIFVFLLTTRVGGLGVNLTAANRVILYDPDWNPSTDIQARERAWRIGQLREVTIYRLILSGTIEEKMYHRQIFKQFLTNRVLKDPKQKRFFKSNDLLELFTFNESSKGTESEAIFAGTGSSVKPKKSRKNYKQPKEKSSGKFRGVPNLVKQSIVKPKVDEEATTAEENNTQQNEYVLRKLFKKTGVEAALKHDRIVDTDEADYMLVEKEAEMVAKKAINALKRSREECWDAESGNANWTGNQGQVREPPQQQTQQPRLRFGKKKVGGGGGKVPVAASATKPSSSNEQDKFFQGPAMNDNEATGGSGESIISETSKPPVLSSSDLLAIIRARKNSIPVNTSVDGSENAVDNDLNDAGPELKSEQLDLLQDIRAFIAFQSMVNGQATTDELVERFGSRLPGGQTPLFKQMLGQLCNFRKVEGRGVWRLKLEFR